MATERKKQQDRDRMHRKRAEQSEKIEILTEALVKIDGHLTILLGNIHGSEKIDHRWEGMEEVVNGWRSEIALALGDGRDG